MVLLYAETGVPYVLEVTSLNLAGCGSKVEKFCFSEQEGESV